MEAHNATSLGSRLKAFPKSENEKQTFILANYFSLNCLKMKMTSSAPHPWHEALSHLCEPAVSWYF